MKLMTRSMLFVSVICMGNTYANEVVPTDLNKKNNLSNSDSFAYNLKPKKVAKDIYCFFGKLEKITKENGGNMVNSCFVQTKNSFVVIDSGPTYAYASQAYAQMQKIAPLPIAYVITTHDHDDHWLGNSFYKEKGAKLIGPKIYEQNVFKGMQTRMQRLIGDKLFQNTKIVQLDTVVDHNLTLKTSGKTFEITQPERSAHTKGDLIIFLPSQKVLFVGDLVFNGRLTSLRDGSLLGSLDALDKIDAYHADTIISGHGFETDAHSTENFRVYLSQMRKEVRQALDDDIGMESITKKVVMPKFKTLKMYDETHNRNVLHAYKELEMLEEDDE